MKKTYELSIFYVAVVLMTMTFFPTQIFADETKPIWQQVDESQVPKRGKRTAIPEKYLVFRLDQNALQATLTEMPLENSDAARTNNTVIEIPQPDGTIERFRIEETQVLSPQLAAQYPTWKTFVGYGIDNPQAVGRFDWNIQGFHGYIESGKGTVLIDPYQKGDTKNYLVYYKHEYGSPDDEFSCKIKDDMSEIIKSDYKPDFLPDAPEFAFGETLRTYRIAIATTGEWSRNASGFDSNPTLTPQQIRDGALAVVVTTLNRLIGIYIRELSSSFQLVNPPTNSANNIIFDNPNGNNDPYINDATDAELNANQATLDTRVGTANYDIGHLYGTGGGGVASSPGLCRGGQGPVNNAYPNNKAKGYSARGTITGDPFVVDYVAHEIGHQFGANHTYNNVDPSGTCTTRSATNAFEVASGATIMSYVGICGARNLQQFNDFGLPSFHIRSLTQIDNNIRTDAPSETPGCGPASGTNAVPNVNAGTSFNIPKLTPFTLTATGSDTDDPAANLLYSWEQYDLAPAGGSGTSGTPAGTYDVDTDGVARPLFRVYSPVSSSSRTYPSLTFILNPQNNDASADVNGVRGNQPVLTYQGTHPTNAPGAVCGNDINNDPITCVIGERLPTINRTMNFRVSVRDRRGGVVDAGTTVTVAAGAGPFQVTTQNASPVSWTGGTSQTVTWDVAGTTANNINAANVNILLSTDGGQTFPVTILANTTNDGTEQITVPNNPTMQARIKIEPVGNIFFDISNADFTITAGTTPTPTPTPTVTPSPSPSPSVTPSPSPSVTPSPSPSVTPTPSPSPSPSVSPSPSPSPSVSPTPTPLPGLVVDTTSNASLTACTTAPNDCSLRGAISNANNSPSNDTITFAIPATNAGCANGLCTITLASELEFFGNTGTLLIDNSAGASRIAVSGNNATRVFNIDTFANLTLTNIAVINGTVVGGFSNGGGILNNGSTLTLNNVTVSNNSASDALGGGIVSTNGSTLTLNNSTVSGNTATEGGGIFIGGISTVTLNNSTVSGNTATSSFAGGGGGINNSNGTVNVVNSTVAFNSSTLASCTNCAGGIRNNSGTVTLTNSLVAKNTVANATSSPDVRGAFATASSFNLIGSGTGATGITNGTNGNQVGTTASPIDPLLGALADNGGQTRTHALQTGSPAIDKGNGTGSDQRGLTRPVDDPNSTNGSGNLADIGAFEVQAAVAQVFYEADVSARPNGDGSILPDDVVQMRRFLNGTDTANQATTEYQRADSAPRAFFGDGSIVPDDVIQARRYQNGTDARQVAAGPTGPGPRPAAAEPTRIGNLTSAAKLNFVDLAGQSLFGDAVNLGEITRRVFVENASSSPGQIINVNIRVDADNTEAEYAFTLSYDQTKLSNPVIGASGAGASVRDCNTGVAGQVTCSVGGFPINSPASSSQGIGEIAAGFNQILLTVQFTVAANAAPGMTPLTLSNVSASTDAPVLVFPATTNGTVTVLGTTAAPVAVSGRVVSSLGRGIANARVISTDQNGVARVVRTNPFGYYRFIDVAAGQIYSFEVFHKSYRFTPRVVSVTEDLDGLDFTADSN